MLVGRQWYQLKKLQLKGMSFDPSVVREKLCLGEMYSMVGSNNDSNNDSSKYASLTIHWRVEHSGSARFVCNAIDQQPKLWCVHDAREH
jgi:hypothetical protein